MGLKRATFAAQVISWKWMATNTKVIQDIFHVAIFDVWLSIYWRRLFAAKEMEFDKLT